MRLSVFIKYQNESENPIMCLDPDHSMALVPFMTNDLVIELRCFVSGCEYKVTPGLLRYQEILEKQVNA